MPDWLVIGVITGVYDDIYFTEVCTLLSGAFLFLVMTLIVVSYLVRVLRIGNISLSLPHTVETINCHWALAADYRLLTTAS